MLWASFEVEVKELKLGQLQAASASHFAHVGLLSKKPGCEAFRH